MLEAEDYNPLYNYIQTADQNSIPHILNGHFTYAWVNAIFFNYISDLPVRIARSCWPRAH